MSISKTRQRLIDVARELFATKGIEATTMNDIAALSGRGRRTLYTYFRNKEELFVFIVGGFYAELRELFVRIVREGENSRVAVLGADEAAGRWYSILSPLVDRRTELLITASEGTRYAGFRSELEQKLLTAVGLMCGWYPAQPDPEVYPVNLYISAYIDAAIAVSRRYSDKNNAHTAVENLLRTALAGFAAVTENYER